MLLKLGFVNKMEDNLKEGLRTLALKLGSFSLSTGSALTNCVTVQEMLSFSYIEKRGPYSYEG